MTSCAAKVAKFCQEDSHGIEVHRSKVEEWNKLLKVITRLEGKGEDGVHLGNYLLTLFAVEKEVFDPDLMVVLDTQYSQLFLRPAGQLAA